MSLMAELAEYRARTVDWDWQCAAALWMAALLLAVDWQLQPQLGRMESKWKIAILMIIYTSSADLQYFQSRLLF